jgi:hypothetical protein
LLYLSRRTRDAGRQPGYSYTLRPDFGGEFFANNKVEDKD